MERKEISMPVDGNTVFNLELEANKRGMKLDLFGLTEVCTNLMESYLGCACTVPNELKTVYMGYENNVSERRRQFNLDFMGAGFHWCGAELQNGKEKEIDARFDDDLLSVAYREKIDGVILLTNDRDHRPLAQTLKRLKIPTLLIYEEVFDDNGEKIIGYSKELFDACDFKIPLFSLINNPQVFKPLNIPSVSLPPAQAPAKKVVVLKRKTPAVQSSAPAQTSAPAQAPTSANQGNGGYVLRKKTNPNLQQKVVNAIQTVISNKEQRWNTSLRFALTSEVGAWLKKSGVTLPYGKTLTDYFKANPSVFHVGYHPRTGAATVSV